jgi:hypothetical protein
MKNKQDSLTPHDCVDVGTIKATKSLFKSLSKDKLNDVVAIKRRPTRNNPVSISH